MGSDERIKHVVVLMLENRSFDHMLGFLHHEGLKPVTGLSNPADPQQPQGFRYPTFKLESYTQLGHDPMHAYFDVMQQLTGMESGWNVPVDLNNQGFAWNYHESTHKEGKEVLGCYDEDRLPVLYTLAREYAVCARWFCSVPGETWPNRLFAHAGTSDDELLNDVRYYYNRTIFEALSAAPTPHSWRIYAGDIPQVAAYQNLGNDGQRHFFGLSDFLDDAHDGVLQDYSFIEPYHFVLRNDQHPRGSVPRGEELIREVYGEIASNQKMWESTLLIITYDEHGGLFDREPPPAATPPRPHATHLASGFQFDLLGPRVPAIVVSPYIRQGTVDRNTYDHTSIIATLCEVFGVDETLTDRVAHAKSVVDLLTEAAPRRPVDLPEVEDIPDEEYGPDQWADGINADGTIRLDNLQEELVKLAQLIDDTNEVPSGARPLPEPPFFTAVEIEAFIEAFRIRQLNRM